MRKWSVVGKQFLEGDLIINVKNFDDRVQRAMVAGANYTATRVESFMKTNAKWVDRTGNARDGLNAEVKVESGEKIAILLYHTMPYGPFLEVRWGGKYGIISPSIEYGAPLFIEAVGRLIRSS